MRGSVRYTDVQSLVTFNQLYANNLTLDGDLTLFGNLRYPGNTINIDFGNVRTQKVITEDLRAYGNVWVSRETSTRDANVRRDLHVHGNTTVSDLTAGNVHVQNDLFVDGNAFLANLKVGEFSVQTVTGNLDPVDFGNIDKLIVRVAVIDNTYSGNLYVSRGAYLSNGLQVQGCTTSTHLTALEDTVTQRLYASEIFANALRVPGIEIGPERGRIFSDGTITANRFVATDSITILGGLEISDFITGNGRTLNGLNASNVNTGVLAVSHGGTGAEVLSKNRLLLGNGNAAVVASEALYVDEEAVLRIDTDANVAGNLLVGGFLLARGKISTAEGFEVFGGSDLGFSGNGTQIASLNVSNVTTGVLAVSHGGTGQAALVDNRLLVGAGTNPVQSANLYWQDDALGVGAAPVAGNALSVSGNVHITDNLSVGGFVFAAGKISSATGKEVVNSDGGFNGNGGTLFSLNASNVNAGVLAVAHGGTGRSALSKNRLLLGNGDSAIVASEALYVDEEVVLRIDTDAEVAGNLLVGGFLLAQGKISTAEGFEVFGGSNLGFSGNGTHITSLNVSNAVQGILSVQHGGTGQTALVDNRLLVGAGTNPVQSANLYWQNGALGVGASPVAGNALSVHGNVHIADNLSVGGFVLAAGKITSANGVEVVNSEGGFTGNGGTLFSLNASNVNAGVLAVSHGGTGQTALVDNRLLVGAGTNPVQSANLYWQNGALGVGAAPVAGNALSVSGNVHIADNLSVGGFVLAAGKITSANGVEVVNSEGGFTGNGGTLFSLNASNVNAGVLAVAHGGTGRSALSKNRLLLGNGDSAVVASEALYVDEEAVLRIDTDANVAGNLLVGGFLLARGKISTAEGFEVFGGSDLGFSGNGTQIASLNVSNVTTGVLAVSHGGTGRAALVDNRLLVGAGTNPVQSANLYWQNGALGVGAAPVAGNALSVHGNVHIADNLSVGGFVLAAGKITSATGVEVLNSEGGFTGNGGTLFSLNASNVNAGVLAVAHGGTGQTALVDNRLLVGAGTNPVQSANLYWQNGALGVGAAPVAGNALSVHGNVHIADNLSVGGFVLAAGKITSANGVEVVNSEGGFTGNGGTLFSLNASNVNAGVLAVSHGGTGRSALSKNRLLLGNGDAAVVASDALYVDEEAVLRIDTDANVAGNLLVGGFLLAQGRISTAEGFEVFGGSDLGFSGNGTQIASLNVSNATTGVLAVSHGGTGQTALVDNRLLVGAGTNPVQSANLYWQNDALGVGAAPVAGNALSVSGNVHITDNLSVGGFVLAAGKITSANGVEVVNSEGGFTGNGGTLFSLNASNVNAGVLAVSHGGTGQTALVDNRLLVGAGTNPVQSANLYWQNGSLGVGAAPVAGNALSVHGNVHIANNLSVGGFVLAAGKITSANGVEVVNSEGGFTGNGGTLFSLNASNVNAGVLAVSHGGTGRATLSNNRLLVGAGTNPVQSANLYWQNGALGVGAAPVAGNALSVSGNVHIADNLSVGGFVLAAGKITSATGVEVLNSEGGFTGNGGTLFSLNASNVNAGVLAVSHGGTGRSALSKNRLLLGNGDSAVVASEALYVDEEAVLRIGLDANVAGNLLVGGFLLAQGKITSLEGFEVFGGSDLGFSGNGTQIASLNVSNAVQGVLSVRHGGTGQTALSNNRLLVGAGTNPVQSANLYWQNGALGVGAAPVAGNALSVSGNVHIADNLSVGGFVLAAGKITSANGVEVVNSEGGFTGNGGTLFSLNASNVNAGVLAVAHGGTGRSALSKNRLLLGNGDSAVVASEALYVDEEAVLRIGLDANVAGNLLVGGFLFAQGKITSLEGFEGGFVGTGSYLSSLNASNVDTGVLAVSHGGTGRAALSNNRLLVGAGTNPVQSSDLYWQNGALGVGAAPVAGNALSVSGNVHITDNLSVGGFVLAAGKITSANGVEVVNSEGGFNGNGASISGLNASNVNTGILAVSHGGTGRTALSKNRLLLGNGDSAVVASEALYVDEEAVLRVGMDANVAGNLLVGGFLLAQGKITSLEGFEVFGGSDLGFSGNGTHLTSLNVSNAVQGVLSVRHGGTGQTALSNNRLLVGAGTNPIQPANLYWQNGALGVGAAPVAGNALSVSGNVHITDNLSVGGFVLAAGKITSANGVEVVNSEGGFTGNGGTLFSLNASNVTTGILAVSHGGTGAEVLSKNRLLLGNGKAAVVASDALYVDEDAVLRIGLDANVAGNLLVGGFLFAQGKITSLEGFEGGFVGTGSYLSSLNASNVDTGVLAVSHGGTGRTALSKNRLLLGNGDSAVVASEALYVDEEAVLRIDTDANVAGNLLVGGFLLAQGKISTAEGFEVFGGSNLGFSGNGTHLTSLNVSNAVQGVLSVRHGGTGQTALSNNRLLVGAGTNPVQSSDLYWQNGALGVGAAPVAGNALSVSGNVHITENLSVGGFVLAAGKITSATGVEVVNSEGGFNGNGASISGLNASNVTTGVLAVSHGGTGRTALSKNRLLLGNGNAAVVASEALYVDEEAVLRIGLDANVAGNLLVGGFLLAQGKITSLEGFEVFGGSDLGFSGNGTQIASLNVSNVTTGVLAVSHGGTGQTALSNNRLLVGAGTNPVQSANLYWQNGALGVGAAPVAGNALSVSGNVHITENLSVGGFVLAAGKITSANGVEVVNSEGGFTGNGGTLFSLNASNVTTGVLAVSHGGTGTEVLSKNRLLLGNGNAAVVASDALYVDEEAVLRVGMDANVAGNLRVGGFLFAEGKITSLEGFEGGFVGTGNYLSSLNASNVTTGVLAVSHGGTGQTALSNNRLLVGAGTNPVQSSDLYWQNGALGVGAAPVAGNALSVSGNVHITDNLSVGGFVLAAGKITSANGVEVVNSEGGFNGNGASISGLNASNVNTGILAVSHGGTGRTALPKNRLLLGNGNAAVVASDALYVDEEAVLRVGMDANVAGNLRVGGFLFAEGKITSLEGFEGGFVGTGNYLSSLNASNVDTGVLAVSHGGTGRTALSKNRLLLGNGDSAVVASEALYVDEEAVLRIDTDANVTGNLLVGGFLLAQGKISTAEGFEVFGGSDLGFSGNGTHIASLNVSNVTTGVLAVSHGGTGQTALSNNRLLVGAGTNPVQSSDLYWQNGALGVGAAPVAGNTLSVSGNVHITENLSVGGFVLAAGKITSVTGVEVLNSEGGFNGNGASISGLNASNVNTGTLAVSHGGTGAETLSKNRLLLGNGDSAVVASEALYVDEEAVLRVGMDANVAGNLRVGGFLFAEGKITSLEGFEGGFVGTGNYLSSLNASNVDTGVLAVSHGGTGRTALPKNRLLLGNGDSAVVTSEALYVDEEAVLRIDTDANVAGNLLVGGFLLAQGRISTAEGFEVFGGSDLGFSGNGTQIASLNVSNVTTGVLAVSHGGTGQTALSNNRLLVGAGTNPVQSSDLYWQHGALGVGAAPVAGNTLSVSGNVHITENLSVGGFVLAAGKITSATGVEVLNSEGGLNGNGASISGLNASNVTTGVLAVSHGGTGSETLSKNRLLLGNGNAAVVASEALYVDEEAVLRVGMDANVAGNLRVGGFLFAEGKITSLEGFEGGFVGTGNYLSSLNASNVDTGVLAVSHGGTGRTALSKNRLLLGNGDSAVVASEALYVDEEAVLRIDTDANVAGNLLVGGFLLAQGKISTAEGFEVFGGSDLGFSGNGTQIASLNVSNVTTGVLAVSHGGTGQTALSNNRLLVGAGTSPVQSSDLYWQNGALGVGAAPVAGNALSVSGNVHITENLSVGGFVLAAGKITSATGVEVLNSEGGLNGNGASISGLNASNVTTGVLAVDHGGTGAETLSKNRLLLGNGNAAVVASESLYVDQGASGDVFKVAIRANIADALVGCVAIIGGQITSLASHVGTPSLFSSDGTRLVLNSAVEYPPSIGVTSNTLWHGVDAQSQYSWYVGNTPAMTLYANGDLFVSGDVVAFAAGSDPDGEVVLSANGSGLYSLNASNVTTGVLSVEQGGTGRTALSKNRLLLGNGNAAVVASEALYVDEGGVLRVGMDANVAGNLLVGGFLFAEGKVTSLEGFEGGFVGTGSYLSSLNASNVDTGVLAVSHGGTGRTALSNNRLLVGAGTNPVESSDLYWQNGALGVGAAPVTGNALSVSGNVYITENLSVGGFVLAAGKITSATGVEVLNSEGGLIANGASLSGLNASNVTTGVLAVSHGGTGRTALSKNRLLLGNGDAAVVASEALYVDEGGVLRVGMDANVAGNLLVGGFLFAEGKVTSLEGFEGGFVGTGSYLSSLNASNVDTGVLAVSHGGTGRTALSNNRLLVGAGTNPVESSDLYWQNGALGVGAAPVAGNALSVSGNVHITENLSVGGFVLAAGKITSATGVEVLNSEGGLNGNGASINGLNASNVTTGVLAVSHGGTGRTALSKNRLLLGNGDAAVVASEALYVDEGGVLRVGMDANVAGNLLVGGFLFAEGKVTSLEGFEGGFVGTGSYLSSLNASNVDTGVLAVSHGGTGRTALSKNRLLLGNGDAAVVASEALYVDEGGVLRVGMDANVAGNLLVGGFLFAEGKVTSLEGFEGGFVGTGSYLSSLNASNVDTGVLAVSHGGTGRTALSNNRLLVGAGTSPVQSSDLYWQNGALGVGAAPVAGNALSVSGNVHITENLSVGGFVLAAGKITSATGVEVLNSEGGLIANGASLSGLNASNVDTGVLAVSHGGTGRTALSKNRLLLGNGDAAVVASEALYVDEGGVLRVGMDANVAGNLLVGGFLFAEGKVTSLEGFEGGFVGTGSYLSSLNASNVDTGVLAVSHGGTGRTALSKNRLLLGNGDAAVVASEALYVDEGGVLRVGMDANVAGNLLVGGFLFAEGKVTSLEGFEGGFVGTGSYLSSLNASNVDTGVLAVSHGGTGRTALSKNRLLLGNGDAAVVASEALYVDEGGVLRVGMDANVAGNLLVGGFLFAEGKVTSLEGFEGGFVGTGSYLSSLNASNVDTGVLAVSHGGTGRTALSKNRLLLGNGDAAVVASEALYVDEGGVLRVGMDANVAGNLLVGGFLFAEGKVTSLEGFEGGFVGTGSYLSSLNASNVDTGVLAVSHGGTGRTALSKNRLLLGNGDAAVVASEALYVDEGGVLRVGMDANVAGNLLVGGFLFAEGKVTSLEGFEGGFVGTGSYLSSLNASNVDTGVLAVSHGGTGRTALSKNRLLLGNGDAAVVASEALYVDENVDGNPVLRVELPANIGNAIVGCVSIIGGQITSLASHVGTPSPLSSDGTRLVLNFAQEYPPSIGVTSNTLWHGVDAQSQYSWYVGNTPAMTLHANGDLFVSGDVVAFASGSDPDGEVVLAANGSGLYALNASNVTTGVLSVEQGGTGRTALSENRLLLGNGNAAIVASEALYVEGGTVLRIGMNANVAGSLLVLDKVVMDAADEGGPSASAIGSDGTKLVLRQGSDSSFPCALGITSNTMWYGARSTDDFEWYAGNQTIMRLESDGNLFVKGDVVAYGDAAEITFSDARLKSNIEIVNQADQEALLEQLNTYQFEWNEKATVVAKKTQGDKEVGLIAQELRSLLPSCVTSRRSFEDTEEYLVVRYEKLVPYLVSTCKSLLHRVRRLESVLGVS
jgi:hypothetical protein